MTTRRDFLTGTGLFVIGTALVRADQPCTISTKDSQAATTPDQALARLKLGNTRVLEGKTIHCDILKEVRETSGGQAPFAAVLACMDSRVAPELVFDQRIGSLFSVRVAGNFVNTDILGSLGAKLIVVLGHTDCGAIKGAVDHVQLGNLTATLENIRPAVLEVAGAATDYSAKDKVFVQKVADRNAKDAAQMLTSHSTVMATLVAERKLKIVSAMHDVSTGAVTWL
jgi:carbonic anhydrase